MGINDDDVAAVRSTSDIVQVVTEYTPLRRVGRQWDGCRPFHSEKTPSFSVNPNDNVFYCFGCQAKGDVIAFVMEKEALDFPGAVERLATKAGISLRYTDRNVGEGRKKRARHIETMARAVDWYHQRLLVGPDAGPPAPTCAARARRRRGSGVPDRLGTRRLGRAVRASGARPGSWPRAPGWDGQQPGRLQDFFRAHPVPDLRRQGDPSASAVVCCRRRGPRDQGST